MAPSEKIEGVEQIRVILGEEPMETLLVELVMKHGWEQVWPKV